MSDIGEFEEARMVLRSWGPMYTADRQVVDDFEADLAAFEAAVRTDERHRIMDNDIASANMGRLE